MEDDILEKCDMCQKVECTCDHDTQEWIDNQL